MILPHKTNYDVIVVGAGPAGATLGYMLADSGYDVLGVDKAHFPRKKLCAGGITWKTKTLVEKIFQVQFEDTFPIKHTSNTVFLYEGSKEIVRCQAPKPFLNVERASYDSELVSLAQKKGCQFIFGERVQQYDVADNVITTHSGLQLTAKIIVSAEGANSRIRNRRLSIRQRRAAMGLALQVDIPIENCRKEFQDPVMRIFFGFSNFGYGWIFPFGDYFKIGIFGLILKNKSMVHNFKVFLSKVAELDTREMMPFEGHLIPTEIFVRQPGAEQVLLIGDAAGLTDPYSGEGIYYAHKSAECAYQAIHTCLNSGEKEHLVASYMQNLRSVLYELKLAKRFSKIIYKNKFRTLAATCVKRPVHYEKVLDVTHGHKSYADVPGLALAARWKNG